MQRKYGMRILWAKSYLCTQSNCPVAIDGVPLYSDSHHLTPAGASFLIAPIAAFLPPAPPAPPAGGRPKTEL
jgi:hypothetical protein